MALDPSIYNNVGRVNVGAGLSDILDQQRQREMQRTQQEQTLASLAQQKELGGFQLRDLQRKEAAIPVQQAHARSQELNSWLSSAVQSGRPQEEVMAEAIAKGQEIGVAPEVTQKHVASVFASAQTPQGRSDFAFTQANPELVAKQRAEAMFPRQGTQAAPSAVGKLIAERELLPPNDRRRAIYDSAIKKETERQDNTLVAITNPDGTPMLVPRAQAAGQTPYQKPGAKNAALTPQQLDQASLKAQQTLNQLQKLNDHPGRQAGTGASSFLSAIPATDAKGFSSELKTFQSKAFLDAVQAMKGLGALTEAEGARLVSSIGALDPAMKEEEFAANLQQAAQEIYDMAKAKGLDVQMPQFAVKQDQQSAHPEDIQAILNKHR